MIMRMETRREMGGRMLTKILAWKIAKSRRNGRKYIRRIGMTMGKKLSNGNGMRDADE